MPMSESDASRARYFTTLMQPDAMFHFEVDDEPMDAKELWKCSRRRIASTHQKSRME